MKFEFSSKDRLTWLTDIAVLADCHESMDETLILDFPGLMVEDIGPEHITPLACLVEFLDKHGVMIFINDDCPVGEYLCRDIKMASYWKGHENYAEVDNNSILNLWRINKPEIEVHPRRVEAFFKSQFKEKDLSSVSLSLMETYYNVQDHSNCEGNAFSMIAYDDSRKMLAISVCDFGDGIPTTVRRVLPGLTDKEALEKAMEMNFSIKSTSHNAGKGLNNIKSSCSEKDSYLWIVSNEAILAATADQERFSSFPCKFPGTWVYYRIPLQLLPEEDYVADFEW